MTLRNNIDGLKCPSCGRVEQYKGKVLLHKADGTKYRELDCVCGVRFTSLEVVIGTKEIKRRIRPTKNPDVT